MKTILLTTALAAFCFGSFAHAQAKTKYYAEGTVPTPLEVARAMAGPNFKPKVKMRGLAIAANSPMDTVASASIDTPATPSTTFSMGSSAIDVVAKSPAAKAAAADAGVLAMAIPFAFDSAKLAPEASPMLDSVAEGMKLLGDSSRVVIEGHTDAVGNPVYNTRLSRNRAAAVKRYLVATHGISPKALVTQGKGSREPLSGLQPAANENRRVQFRLG
jgi:outer membrane protein OmpA-like peptidoglycan-associated protein